MRRPWIAALTIVLAMSAAAAADTPAQQQTERPRAKYVTPDFGNAYTFTEAITKKLGVLVSVTPEANVMFKNLKASVTAVAVGNSIDGAKLEHFTAALLSPAQATPQIMITTDEAALTPGVYTVTVEIAQDPQKPAALSPPKKAKASDPEPAVPLPQRLALQLTMPAAEVKAPSAQTIDLVRYCFRCPADRYPVLHVQESGNHIGLTAEVRQNDKMTATDGSVIDATIRSVRAIPIKRNQVGDIPLMIENEGELPLGKASTTVAITSNELAASIQVPYEIRVRLAEWLLLPAILAGLGFGFLLRVLLKGLIERDTAMVSAYDLLQAIKSAAGRERDGVFRKNVDKVRGDIVEALTGDAATITAAVTAGKAALDEAKKDLVKRLDDLANDVARMESMTKAADKFMATIAGALRRADQRLASVRSKLTQRDAAAGSAELAALKDDLASDVKTAAADWAAELQNAIARIQQFPPLPPPYPALLKTAVEQLAAKVNIIAGQSLEAMLDAINDAQFLALHAIEIPIFTPLAGYGASVAQELGDRGSAIEKAAQVLEQALAGDEPHTPAPSVEALDKLLQKMRDTIVAVAKLGPDEQRGAINELVTAGKYLEAAASISAGEIVAEKAIAQGAVPMLASEQAAAQPWWGVVVSAPPGAAAMTEDWVSAGKWSRLSLAVARALNSFSIAVLLALVGFAFLLPTFDGTLRGILTAFFWGYASDFSADAITTAAKQVK
jgi:hypothetical protein